MTYILVIVESPAKCQKIEGFLGPGYKCLASYGHLTTLLSLKNIDINNNFKLTFTTISEKLKHIDKLRKAINLSKEVIIATDDDREGEAIGWHICQLFNLNVNTTKRILFNEITKSAILNSINKPSILNLNLINAQQTRQILDLLLGYQISPILWKNISSNTKNSLSAGRCQTPALRLVYDNYLETKDNNGTQVYNTIGYFTDKLFNFNLDYEFNDSDKVEEFLNLSISHKHIISNDKQKESKRNPPQPFTTSLLQQVANNNLHISPKETMKICQKLYEEGLITYMRTDSKIYSKEFIEISKKFIENKYGSEYFNINFQSSDQSDKKSKDNKNLAQEAHEAIRPTDINKEDIDDKFTKKEINLYKLIWKNTIQSCMLPAIYFTILYKISAPNNLFYKYLTESPKFLGWHITLDLKDNLNLIGFNYLPKLKNKEVKFSSISSTVTIKDLKTHYTEAKLVQLLENKGIGRPSTFSSLIDKIQERNYVKKDNIIGKTINCLNFTLNNQNKISKNQTEKVFGNEKNKLVIQPLGIIVIEFLINNFNDLFNYNFTCTMEDKLDLIAKENLDHIQICKEFNSNILNLIGDTKSLSKEEIKLDDHHSYIIGKYGPIIKFTKDNKTTFKKIKDDLDHELIKEKKLTIEEIIDNNTTKNEGTFLGNQDEKDIYLKTGKFGIYITWGDKNISLKSIKKDFNEITFQDIKPFLNQTLIRKINENVSIRNGKYGDYIFYKTNKMKTPKFFKLDQFEDDYKNCNLKLLESWIKEKYNI
jgi:DNA topoisomerase-1